MSRGQLDTSEEQVITNKLPNLDNLQEKVAHLLPDFISLQFKHTSTFPIASVCIKDTTRMLSESRYALFEAYAHQAWYSKTPDEESKYLKVYFSKFYTDDIALRLYAAAEHLAGAILFMLDIERNKIKNSSAGISLASAVGKYLIKQIPTHPITIQVESLIGLDSWNRMMDYRNKWVHDQPPLIEGTGIIWKRQILWRDDGKEVRPGVKARSISIGGGTKPELTIDELLNDACLALSKFAQITEFAVDFYIEMILENERKAENKSLLSK